ncbi:hypothetical protein AYO41_02030 [Verrucomicrobia bacterium SCGC AG-212-E04]|nr:hypothetical protein AYO41_02030 [Verrucomicrobia bacterium SCGC AG-212-E04]
MELPQRWRLFALFLFCSVDTAIAQVAAPVIETSTRDFVSSLAIDASSAVGTEIRYSIDGTLPDPSSPRYSRPLTISWGVLLRLRAFQPGELPSDVVEARFFQQNVAAPPTFSPAAGSYSTVQRIFSSSITPGATIRYTQDGSEPTTQSREFPSIGLEIPRSATLRAKAFSSGLTASPTAVGTYMITGDITAGRYHTLALRTDGTVWAAGMNEFGQLGNGTTLQSLQFDEVPGLTGVTSVAGGWLYSLALQRDGTVLAWGNNDGGQLGLDPRSYPYRAMPAKVPGLPEIVRLATDQWTGYAIDRNGNLWSWGGNEWKQLGDGNDISPVANRPTPALVVGLDHVVSIGPGWGHCLAVREGGDVWAWGSNGSGALGISGRGDEPQAVPTPIPELSSGVIAVAAGYFHSVALKADGTVWTWGRNDVGQLGQPPGEVRVPTQVSGVDRIVAIAAHMAGTLAIRADGKVFTWGFGPLGVHEPNSAQVANLSGIVRGARGQRNYSVAIDQNGRVWVWGSNGNGQLGLPNLLDYEDPEPIPGFSVFAPVPGNAAGGPLIWLSAEQGIRLSSAGRVTGWLDRSAYLNDATAPDAASQPGFVAALSGGAPSVAFDSANAGLVFPAAGFDDFSAGVSIFLAVETDQFADDGALLTFSDPNGLNTIQVGRHDASLLYTLSDAAGNILTSVALPDAFVAGKLAVLEIVHGPTMVSLYRNGILSSQSGASPVPAGVRTRNTIGKTAGGGSTLLGNLSELIVYNRPLLELDRLVVSQYLTEKYLPDVPPPPVALKAAITGPFSVNLSWSVAETDLSGFVLERRDATTITAPWMTIGGFSGTARAFSDQSAPAGTRVQYRLASLNDSGRSDRMDPAGALVISVDLPSTYGPAIKSTMSGGSTAQYLTDTGDTYFSLPFLPPAEILSTVISYGTDGNGKFLTLDPSTSIPEHALAFDPTDPARRRHYYLLVHTGALAGLRLEVADNESPAKIRLAPGSPDLASHPLGSLIAGSDFVSLHAHFSVEELFGTGATPNFVEPDDLIGIYVSPGAPPSDAFPAPDYELAFVPGTGWSAPGGGIASGTEVIAPFAPIRIRRNGLGTVRILAQGFLPVHPLVAETPGRTGDQDVLLALCDPAPGILSTSRLAGTGDPLRDVVITTPDAGAATSPLAEIIVPWNTVVQSGNNTINLPRLDPYVYLALGGPNGGGWKRSLSLGVDGTTKNYARPGGSFLLRRRGPGPVTYWILPGRPPTD